MGVGLRLWSGARTRGWGSLVGASRLLGGRVTGSPCPGSVGYLLSPPGMWHFWVRSVYRATSALGDALPREVVESLPEVGPGLTSSRAGGDLWEDHDGNCWPAGWLTWFPLDSLEAEGSQGSDPCGSSEQGGLLGVTLASPDSSS